jgi:hypothetical protein
MRDRPKTKSQRKEARLRDATDRASAVVNGAATLGLGQAADRLGTPGLGRTIL